MKKLILCLSLLVLSFPSLKVLATGFDSSACKEDQEKFCKGIQEGGGRVYNCLKQHMSELNKDCAAKVVGAEDQFFKMQKACGEDRNKFCKDVQPGGGRILQCLQGHQADLTVGCQSAIQSI